MTDTEKPEIETIVDYFKQNIPGCGITDAEIEDLRQLYPNVSYKDVRRVFYQAYRNKALQPISYMLRQLRIIKPELDPKNKSDPFNTQVNQTRARAYGQRVEIGTDWHAIYAKMDAERDTARREYEVKHGIGSYDEEQARQCEELRKKFEQLGEKQYRETYGVDKHPKPPQGYDTWDDKRKQWYDDLWAGVFDLMKKDEGAI